MHNSHKPYGPYEKYFKRIIDVSGAIGFLVLFCWLYLIIAVLVRINLGSPVIFKQERPGKNEKIFKLYKFRSMTNDRDENGKLLSDEERLTKFGSMIRSTSLDELPEVINILKGQMSWIGPRPLAVQYLPYYSKEEQHRHDVRPGLSGLAQVNGRNALSWEERFKYDIYYVNHVSFRMDSYLLVRTIIKVFKHEDIVVRGSKTAVLDFDVDRKQKLMEKDEKRDN